MLIAKPIIMKTVFTFLITIVLTTLSINANTKGLSSYFICEFTDSISQVDLEELEKEGFQIVEKNKKNKQVYVRSINQKEFSKALRSRMKELIEVDGNGKKVYLIDSENKSPEFVKLFFNFI